MSFSSTAKGELCRTELAGECCELAELSALLHTAGSINISGGALSLRIDTENAAVARRAFLLVKSLYGVHTKTQMHTNQLKHNHIYSLSIDASSARMVAIDTRLMGDDGIAFGADASFISGRCCQIAFVRGAFLGGGSITNPEKRYHMEFVCRQQEFADGLLNIIKNLGCPAKMIPRSKSFIVYLNIENIRVMKSVRNTVNRKVNCETGNLSKTVNASVRQQESIEIIRKHMGLDKLTPALREVAEARISHPEATLEDLAALLGAASKSGVNHKLRKLNNIAEQLKSTRG
jgi:DNA-binding transcriptional regulator WhiA